MKKMALVLATGLMAANTFAYEVWMGTHLVPHAMATNLASWARTAAQLEGVDINLSSNVNDPATTANRRTIFAQFTNASPIYTEVARTSVSIDPALKNELAFPRLAAAIERIFSASATYGYPVEMIMFYDNAATYQGTNYNYSSSDDGPDRTDCNHAALRPSLGQSLAPSKVPSGLGGFCFSVSLCRCPLSRSERGCRPQRIQTRKIYS